VSKKTALRKIHKKDISRKKKKDREKYNLFPSRNFIGVIKLLYSKYLTTEALKNMETSEQIRTVKYANDLVLLTKEETMLEGMIDGLHEIGRCNGMEMKV
jgi:hypothetical protein